MGTENTGRCVAITGASGYVGSRICDSFRRGGHRVVELRRKPNPNPSAVAETRRFVLGEPVGPEVLQGVDWLVHCAYDFSLTRWDEIREVNLGGSRRLFEAAERAGVASTVLISTLSSFEGCRSLYGRAKLGTEKELRRLGGAVIRPGLVFGADAGGMIGTLERLVKRLPVIPLVGGGDQLLYLDHVEDLFGLVLAAARRGKGGLQRPVTAASEQGLSLREIVRILGEASGRHTRTVPIPWTWVWGALRSAEALGLRLSLRSDSVVSLMNQDPDPDFSMTREMGIAFRHFDAATSAT